MDKPEQLPLPLYTKRSPEATVKALRDLTQLRVLGDRILARFKRNR
jgi:hypothetical protein